MGEESLHLKLHCDVGLIGGRECGSVLCGCGRAFVFIHLEERHHLVNNCIGVVEAEFIDGTSFFSEFKVSFAEVVLEVFPRFVCLVCAFPRSGVIFEDPLLV